jgi:hypothetical protein
LAEAHFESVPGSRPIAVTGLQRSGAVRVADAEFIGFVSTGCSFQDLLWEFRAAKWHCSSAGSPTGRSRKKGNLQPKFPFVEGLDALDFNFQPWSP